MPLEQPLTAAQSLLFHGIAVFNQELPKSQAQGSEISIYPPSEDILNKTKPDNKINQEDAFQGLISGSKP